MQKTKISFSKKSSENFLSLEVAESLYQLVLNLKLKSYLQNQLEHASSSVVLNLVEGNARRTLQDKRRFYNYALASAKEAKAVLKLAGLAETECYDLADKVCAYTYKLVAAL